jgi:hypothetical protein
VHTLRPAAVGCRLQVDIDDLTEARAEAARALKSAQGEEVGRVQEATQMTKTVATWVASVPAKLGGLAKMSRAEWATMLGGFWVAIKKEAHHFWVRAARRRLICLPGAEPAAVYRWAASSCTLRFRSPCASLAACCVETRCRGAHSLRLLRCCACADNAAFRRERKQLTRTTADMFRLVPPFIHYFIMVLIKTLLIQLQASHFWS